MRDGQTARVSSNIPELEDEDIELRSSTRLGAVCFVSLIERQNISQILSTYYRVTQKSEFKRL